MRISVFTNNNPFELCANSYVLVDSSNRCIVIDPSVPDIIRYIDDNKLKLVAILLTHGHFDHIRVVDKLIDKYQVPFFINKQDVELLTRPELNCSDSFCRNDIVVKHTPEYIKEGDILKLFEYPIKVIETPFHTMGSVCFYLEEENVLFSGDTLFCGSVGRMDLPTSNPSLFSKSLAKLMTLDDRVFVYPGHGEKTTIANERN